MKLAFTIPDPDLTEFANLKDECRAHIRKLLQVMERLCDSAGSGIGRAIRTEASIMGISEVRLRAIYDKFRSHGWHGLVDRRRFPESDAALPSEIVELWRALCERNQRKCKPAFRELARIMERESLEDACWRVLGIKTAAKWPAIDPMTGYPRGCAYRSLLRRKPTKYELTLARIGRSAASKMLPKVLTTRTGLLVGQVYICDDQDYDLQIGFVGVNRKITRPSGFNGLCLAAGAEVCQGYKPTVLNSDGTMQKLKQVDYEWFLVNLLTTCGYRQDTGTVIIDENGTTKASDEFEQRVQLATNGKVSFDRSGIHGEQIAGMFRGQPRGNPGYKAARESWFNLLRNEMAALAGPTGMDRNHAPEENYGLEKYTRDLLDVATARPELAERLMLPVLRWHDFVRLTAEIVMRINRRGEDGFGDHDLEGWAENTTELFRLSIDHQWSPASQLLALPPAERAAANAVISHNSGLWRFRKLSPWEVWVGGNRDLKRVAGAAIPILLGAEGARKIRVRPDHQIVIEDGEIDVDEMWFDAELVNGRILEQGREYLAYLNPYAAGGLEICLLDGRWMGTAPRVARVSKLDTEGARARYGNVRRIESRLGAPVAARGSRITRDRTAMHKTNSDLIAGNPVTPEEKSRDRALRKLGKSGGAESLIEPAEPAEIFETPVQPSNPAEGLL